ncbi:8-amino-7-oxononanoate synthase [Nocardioides psychrotolerans]|uniref:8-amino-7-oxononanoate synthase n=1 Tax=Nocardioides psychrotolerans TaxID=1005945 RepID=A0A1I3CRW7_9ACTN|nr:8-amino-7-oxononanoate synthase [Nocardioides psychrotolerans]GEP36871.1 8-amino-7-oxononanoate synthase [Nocardioides psychrotolerans]SFH77009.1 8-amino-7-oxononanoate synthase [Nocardioides psychrotolerans]
MSAWSAWLAAQAGAREEAGLRRVLRPRPASDETIDLAGNDYLGLSRDPVVTAAAADAALMWGAGSGASRLVTGTLRLHEHLEQELASYTGQPAALVMSTGYHANLALVTALADRDTLVVSDAHIHASLVDAVRLSRAEVVVVPHSDVAAVRRALVASDKRALVLTESIYSVLGDEAPLVELAAVCAEHDAMLVVDEAHGLGVHGPGLVHGRGLAGLEHVVVTMTLSKSLGSQGGAVLGPPALVEHLVNKARPFIFDTALAPAPTAGALAALGVLRARPELVDVVRRRVVDLAAALGVEPPAGAVLSVSMPSPQVAVAAQAAALEHGLRIGCFRPPSVPDGISRLRITVNAGVSDDDWGRATQVLVAVVKEHA